MAIPQNWQAVAHNQVPHSQNRIHGDEIAKRLGYTGALVPGVAQSAYLIHPAVVAWGDQWLRHGCSKVVVKKPLYDGVAFEVVVTNASATAYQADLINASGECCAQIDASVQASAKKVDFRGDERLNSKPELAAIPENMQTLRKQGMRALVQHWSGQHDMAHYITDAQAMPELLRFEAGAGKANSSYILGLADWVLAGNAYMNPWVHLQTTCQNFQAINPDESVIVEANIEDLFAKKGHDFVDISAHVFKQSDHSLCNIIQLRAIYRLRDY